LVGWAIWLVVAVGTVLRVRQWWSGRSFWLDELLLLKAMSAQGLGQVLRPLELAQSAPPGWLLAEHLLIDLAPGERGARLLPLAFGIGALVLTALLARTLLGGPAALAATAIAAVSTPLVQYSAELKQYSADGFWLQLVLLLAVRLALRRDHSWRPVVALGAVAAVAVWFSHATAIAIGGVFLALGLLALADRRWRRLAVLVGCAVPAAAALAVEYVTLLAKNSANPVLAAYWVRAFPPDGPLTWAVGWHWVSSRSRAVVRDPVYWHSDLALAGLALAGLVALAVRRRRALPVLLLPVAAVAAAGLVGAYPVSGRLALWVIPLLAIVVAAPLDLLLLGTAGWRLPRLPAPAWWASVAVALVLALAALAQLMTMVGPAVGTDLGYLAAPRKVEEARPAFQLVARSRRPGDLVLVDAEGSAPAAEFYGPRTGLGTYLLVTAVRPGTTCRRTAFGRTLRQDVSIRRIWLIRTHTRDSVVQLYARHLEAFGPIAERVEWPGAAVLRFDRARRLPPPAGPLRYCLRFGSRDPSP
jgi:hypothetical protein